MSIIRIDHVTTSFGPGPALDAGATRALLVEARSGLVLALTVLAISLVRRGAETDIMVFTVAVVVALVQVIQLTGTRVARRLDKR